MMVDDGRGLNKRRCIYANVGVTAKREVESGDLDEKK